MEHAIGCFFNTIWLIAGIAAFHAFVFLFSFSPLPLWLTGPISAALAFWLGLAAMFLVIENFYLPSGRKTYREQFVGMLWFGTPFLAAAGAAIALHCLLLPYRVATEVEKWSVGLASCAVFFGTAHFLNLKWERQRQRENDAYRLKQLQKQTRDDGRSNAG